MKKRKVSLEKKRSLRSLKQNWTLLLLLLPACVMILVFNYVPMYGIQIAFRNFNFVDGITGSEWAGLKWFRYLFNSVQFLPVIRNTLVLSFYSTKIFCPGGDDRLSKRVNLCVSVILK